MSTVKAANAISGRRATQCGQDVATVGVGRRALPLGAGVPRRRRRCGVVPVHGGFLTRADRRTERRRRSVPGWRRGAGKRRLEAEDDLPLDGEVTELGVRLVDSACRMYTPM